MGGVLSNTTQSNCDNQPSSTPSSKQYLLGDFSYLPVTACKLFNLGNVCLPTVTNNKQNSEDVSGELRGSTLELFKPLKLTQPLYYGQTYVKWNSARNLQKLSSLTLCSPVKSIIYLQPINEFPEFIHSFTLQSKFLNLNLFDLLQCFCQIYFSGFDCKVLPHISTQDRQWQIRSRIHQTTETKQYLSQDFYPNLQASMPLNGRCILGIIWTDLYPEADLNFVLGESSSRFNSAMFCFGRYEPIGFDKATHQPLSEVDGCLIWKLLRIISHETCHLLGLQHCTFFLCAMNESSSIAEAMSQPLFLCPVCLRKLQKCCGFDVLERYTLLLNQLQSIQDRVPYIKIQDSISWLVNCIQYLKG